MTKARFGAGRGIRSSVVCSLDPESRNGVFERERQRDPGKLLGTYSAVMLSAAVGQLLEPLEARAWLSYVFEKVSFCTFRSDVRIGTYSAVMC